MEIAGLIFIENIFIILVTFFVTKLYFKKREMEFDDKVYKDVTKAKSILNDILYDLDMKLKND